MLEVDVELRRGGREYAYRFVADALVTGVFGRSGAGKSTLLNLVAGLVAPAAGSIRLGGRVLCDRAAGLDVPPHRRGVGMVFQDDRLFPHLSVRANLRYGRRAAAASGGPGPEEVIELLELGDLLGRRVRDLSGGERQRVSLGRALMSGPRLLLLDEPLASIDRGHRRRILRLMARVRDELRVPMLYVSHDLPELLELTDRLIVVEGGRTSGTGSLADAVTDRSAWQVLRALSPLNVLRLEAVEHDAGAGLTAFRPRGAGDGAVRILGPIIDRAAVVALLRAEDVALAERRIEGISIRNQLPGRILRVTSHEDRAIVEVDAGVPLLVEVSRQAVSAMGLAPGREVWCLIKSNAIAYADVE